MNFNPVFKSHIHFPPQVPTTKMACIDYFTMNGTTYRLDHIEHIGGDMFYVIVPQESLNNADTYVDAGAPVTVKMSDTTDIQPIRTIRSAAPPGGNRVPSTPLRAQLPGGGAPVSRAPAVRRRKGCKVVPVNDAMQCARRLQL